jgi:hypothetical protein
MRIKDLYPNNFIKEMIKEVCFNAYSLGLILPCFSQSSDLFSNPFNFGRYKITNRGINYFRNGEIPISSHGLLLTRLTEIIKLI